MSRAEYMRDYRAKRKAGVGPSEVDVLRNENERLTEEVARLKRLLAERSQSVLPLLTREEMGIGPDSRVLPYNRDPVAAAMSEFHPAPKTRKK